MNLNLKLNTTLWLKWFGNACTLRDCVVEWRENDWKDSFIWLRYCWRPVVSGNNLFDIFIYTFLLTTFTQYRFATPFNGILIRSRQWIVGGGISTRHPTMKFNEVSRRTVCFVFRTVKNSLRFKRFSYALNRCGRSQRFLERRIVRITSAKNALELFERTKGNLVLNCRNHMKPFFQSIMELYKFYSIIYINWNV